MKNCKDMSEFDNKQAKHILRGTSTFWFTYLFRSPFGAGCIGRLDQLLYPFYKHDCEMGIWDQQEAEKNA